MDNKLFDQVKEAEVRGVMAAFVDAGMVKVASENAFDNLCGVVADNLGDKYDINTIANVTDAVLSGGMKKTASQQKVAHETARNAALGELLLMKTAGQIDDATFVKEAKALMKMAGGKLDAIKGFGSRILEGVRSAPGAYYDALKGGGIRRANDALRGAEKYRDATIKANDFGNFNTALAARESAKAARRKAIAQTALAYGSTAGALGGAGALGNSLYNKYAE